MSEEARNRLRTLVEQKYIFMITNSLIFISDSKEWLYKNISIHHLHNCLVDGNLYLNRFYFSLLLYFFFISSSLIRLSIFLLLFFNLSLFILYLFYIFYKKYRQYIVLKINIFSNK